MKSFWYSVNKDELSVAPPEVYGKRFRNFMRKNVFAQHKN